MKKIIEVSSDTNIGGAGKCLLTLLTEFDRRKYEIAVILPENSLLKPHIEVLGIDIIEVKGIADKSLDLKIIGTLKKIIKEQKADLVHAHASMSARIAARLAGCKVVYTRHSVFPPPQLISKGIGKVANGMVNNFFADGIIAVAEAAKDNLTETGIDPSKITVILNGINGLTPQTEEQKLETRKKYGLSSDDLVISIVARLEDIKGHDYFIEAAGKLKEKGIKAKFVIAGNGSYEEHLKEKTKEMGLDDTVIFTGFIQDVPSLMNITYIQCNASYGTEATSLALLEGMSLGIPAVVSDFGGNPGVISNGDNGFVVEKCNADALADGIEKLICDDTKYKKMSKRCLEIFNAKFTAKAMTEQTEELYDKIMGNKKGSV